MPRFVIYEVWSRSLIVEADSVDEALENHDPMLDNGFNMMLGNWHAVPLPEGDLGADN